MHGVHIVQVRFPAPRLIKNMKRAEIRQQYIFNQYTIISPKRGGRPRDVLIENIVSKNHNCPFCPQNIDKTNIKQEASLKNGDSIFTLGNVFPALSLKNPKAYGQQEVIVETLKHGDVLADMSVNHIKELIKVYIHRNLEISKNKKIKYILCFKNQGVEAGASLTHAHSQIFASDFLPPEIIEEKNTVKKYQKNNHSCPYCDILKKELKSSRKIASDKLVGAFTPYASQYHYEAWIFPLRHVDNIALLTEDELSSLAKALKKILLKLKKLGLSYNFFLHDDKTNKHQHFYIKIQPRDSIWAGVELGSGIVINSIPPEEAAKYYR